MNFYALSGLINGLTATILGIFVVIRNKRGIKNVTYGLFCLSVSIWSYFYFVWQIAPDRSVALFCSRGFMAGAIFIPVCYLHHLFIFFDIYNQKKKLISYGYLGGVVFSLLSFTPLFVKDVSPKIIFKFWPESGILYHPFLILWFWYVFYGIYVIISEHKKSSGLRRNQLRYMLLATFIGWSGGATNYFLWYDIPIPPFGNIFVSIYMAIVAYAIIRYRLMDITIAIKKTTLLACGVLLPIAGVIIGINLLQPKLTKIMGESWWLVPSGITVILTLALFRFVSYVIRLKDEELSKKIKHYRNQLRAHTEQLAKSKTIRELVSYTVRHISTIARLDFCAIALRKEEVTGDEIKKKRRFYIIEGVSDRTGRHLSRLKGERIEENSDLIIHLKTTKNPLEKGYLQYLLTQSPSLPQKDLFSEITQEMEEWNTELVFPAFSSDELVGLLFLGRKLDGAIYSKEDLELFSLLANQSAKPISEIIQREENIRIILATAHSYLNTLEAKDNYTRSHTQRVKNYCLKIASSEIIKAQLDRISDGVWGLEMAAELHDLGKIGIPDNILNKPAKLTPEEFDLVKEHPKRALNMIGEISVWLKEDIILGILGHQEHYDGTGYPKGLRGDNIHLYARIIHLADAYDAMISERPYRKALSSEVAIEEIKKNSGNQFDPLISGVFIKLYRESKI